MRKLLEEKNPRMAAQALRFLAQGFSQVEVAGKLRIPKSTVGDLALRHRQMLEENRAKKWEDLGPGLLKLSEEAVAQARAMLPLASSKDAAITLGISVEKGLLVSGRATANIAVVHEHRGRLEGVGEALRMALMRRRGEEPFDA